MRTNENNGWMTRTLVAALLVLGTAGFADAFQYKVKPGDTLMSIADKQLGNGKRWREIAQFNGIADPTEMRVGQVLLLPDDGPGGGEAPVEPQVVRQPVIVRSAPAAPNSPSAPAVQPASQPAPAVANTPAPAPVAPTYASRSTPTTATSSTTTTVAATPTADTGAGAGNWSIVQYIGGKIMQNGLIAIVLAAGFAGMMIAWVFSLVTPRNLLALGFVFLVVSAALFFVIR